MAGYYNDYTCSMYDFYMLTGEGAEYFEDTYEEDVLEESFDQEVCHQEEPCFETFDERLDYIIQCLEEEIAEKKRLIAEQNAESNF